MKVLSKVLIIAIIPSMSFLASGCEMLPHALKPGQWHKLNRGPAPRQDTYFSVPDHIPELEQEKSSQNVDEIRPRQVH